MIGTVPGAKDSELINTWFSLLRGLKFGGGSRHVKSQLKYRVIIVINYRKDEKYTGTKEKMLLTQPQGSWGMFARGAEWRCSLRKRGCQWTAGLLLCGQRAQQM